MSFAFFFHRIIHSFFPSPFRGVTVQTTLFQVPEVWRKEEEKELPTAPPPTTGSQHCKQFLLSHEKYYSVYKRKSETDIQTDFFNNKCLLLQLLSLDDFPVTTVPDYLSSQSKLLRSACGYT